MDKSLWTCSKLLNPILLSKLDHYGVSGLANDLFNRDLVGRKQYVYLDDAESDKENFTTGVPRIPFLVHCCFFYLYP